MNLSIVIPNYNGEKLLQKNLPKVVDAVKGYKKGKIEIIIADDPSTDNSSQVIADFIDSLKGTGIVGKTIANKNKKEAGFSKNVNRGVSLAKGEILLLLNSDVIPQNDFLEPLIAHFENEKVFAVGCMDKSIEGGKTVLRGRGVGKWQRGFLMHSKGRIDKTNSLWASGGSSAFRMSIWNELRGFDIIYNPFYWEDIDLSYRALKSGYDVMFEPKSIVMHEHDKGAIRSKFKTKDIQKIAYRNQFLFVWKNITDKSLRFSHYFWLPYHFMNAARRKEWTFFAGFFMALLQVNKVQQSRQKARKLFVLSDRQVLKNYHE
jgi:GT2 family glycosyltransferase